MIASILAVVKCVCGSVTEVVRRIRYRNYITHQVENVASPKEKVKATLNTMGSYRDPEPMPKGQLKYNNPPSKLSLLLLGYGPKLNKKLYFDDDGNSYPAPDSQDERDPGTLNTTMGSYQDPEQMPKGQLLYSKPPLKLRPPRPKKNNFTYKKLYFDYDGNPLPDPGFTSLRNSIDERETSKYDINVIISEKLDECKPTEDTSGLKTTTTDVVGRKPKKNKNKKRKIVVDDNSDTSDKCEISAKKLAPAKETIEKTSVPDSPNEREIASCDNNEIVSESKKLDVCNEKPPEGTSGLKTTKPTTTDFVDQKPKKNKNKNKKKRKIVVDDSSDASDQCEISAKKFAPAKETIEKTSAPDPLDEREIPSCDNNEIVSERKKLNEKPKDTSGLKTPKLNTTDEGQIPKKNKNKKKKRKIVVDDSSDTSDKCEISAKKFAPVKETIEETLKVEEVPSEVQLPDSTDVDTSGENNFKYCTSLANFVRHRIPNIPVIRRNIFVEPREGVGPFYDFVSTHLKHEHQIHARLVNAHKPKPQARNARGELVDHDLPPELRDDKAMTKYWRKRHSLFHRFDDGIQLDHESWFSVTPESVARHIAQKFPFDTVLDAFCGAGGNTIQFAKTCARVIAVDIDPEKIRMARHNARVYGVAHKIDFIVGDFFQLAPQLKADMVFLSPPWGGPAYSQEHAYDVETMLLPRPATELMEVARSISPYTALYVPRNTKTDQLLNLAKQRGGSVQTEKTFLGNGFIAITAYYY